MGNRLDLRVVLGSLRYKSAPNTNLLFEVPLVQTTKEVIEFDRSIDIGLEQVYDDERQASDVFRPSGKFTLIFKNSYSGFTNYTPFENNLYYLNAEAAAKSQCTVGATNVSWTGLPQYNEFDFIRTDYNVSGYTQPPNEHLVFVPKSATSYNWTFYLSYAFENDYTKNMQYVDLLGNFSQWVVGDGIPFIVSLVAYNGRNYISFRCPVKHGLTTGEYVKLNFNYNGQDLFQVDSLGVETYGSEEYVFNILDVGYTGNTFLNGVKGTFKRVILGDNVSDTISEYYVRRNKIITNPDDAVLVKAGFEQNIFGVKKKYESSGYTPNGIARVSIKEGSQSYTLTFNQDVQINPLRDNQKRPISELFFTVIWRGYFGWFLGDKKSPNSYYGPRQGFEFNLPLDNTGNPSPWWLNPLSFATGLTTSYFTNLNYNFVSVNPLKVGDIVEGDYCEWNNYEQKERVISNTFQRIEFNNFNFTTGSKLGYYYQPHHPITIRVYSDYIEEGDVRNVVGIPDYSYFSTTKNLFIWRDLYPYGYVDTKKLGVNYPFLNGTHYPHKNIIFRIIPEGTNYIEQTIIDSPTIDNCE